MSTHDTRPCQREGCSGHYFYIDVVADLWECNTCGDRRYGPPPGPPTCPSCDSLQVSKSIADTHIDVGIPDAKRVRIRVPVSIPVWACEACGLGWRDHESEEIIDRAIREHPEASKRYAGPGSIVR